MYKRKKKKPLSFWKACKTAPFGTKLLIAMFKESLLGLGLVAGFWTLAVYS